jgi:aspartate/methionine/tyrosine aminotransferase
MDLAGHLLENYGVAVVPGEAFGVPGHIRISYAVSEANLVSGFEKIAEAL